MAALSDDRQMLEIYSSRDIYTALSVDIFGVEEKRKIAKKLFLSYAYGMRVKSLVDAAVEQGGDRAKVKAFFANFSVFENWKKSVVGQFEAAGKIGTSCGNYQRRDSRAPITEKEKRACVSQVVQGTASLIFKKSLLRLGSESNVRILIPMHDGVLVEHSPEYDSTRLSNIFSDVMTEHFDKKLVGKASLEPFAPVQ
jgi:DNA polymerase I-like protein with 3'-5' exonuclease and polymerase domains